MHTASRKEQFLIQPVVARTLSRISSRITGRVIIKLAAARRWLESGAVLMLMLAGLVLLMALHAPAWSQEVDEPIDHVAIQYTAAELRDSDGVRRVLTRIDHAALHTCGYVSGASIVMNATVERSTCRIDAVRRAVTQIRNARLAQAASVYDFPVGP